MNKTTHELYVENGIVKNLDVLMENAEWEDIGHPNPDDFLAFSRRKIKAYYNGNIVHVCELHAHECNFRQVFVLHFNWKDKSGDRELKKMI